MLSILIPVYNYDVRGLVSDLLSQIAQVDKPIEICLLNDGSQSKWSEHLELLANSVGVKLHSFTKNQGRVASRNKLAALAQYDTLLFIDCDAQVVSYNYISNYLNNIGSSKVIAGGHVYQEEEPEEEYKLHWKYGREVEVRSLAQRIKKPYDSFSTFNFCVSKEVFSNYLTEIDVTGYGHEDTVMGWMLRNEGIEIQHIHNPLLHSGLKGVNQFLLDTSRSIKNACLIAKSEPDIDIKLIKYSNLINNFGLSGLVLFALNLFENRISNNLNSSGPSLTCLQLYKLKVILELTIGN